MAYACSSPSKMLNHPYSTKHINGLQLVPSSRQVVRTLQNRRRRNQIFSSMNGAIPTVEATTKRLRVAYQGVPGAYSEFAAQTAYPDCSPVPCRAFTNVISAVELGRADLAVVPVESTLEGTAVRNYDLLLQRELYIVQEISLFVHYCLLVMPGVTKGEVKKVISHPMALAHCGRTLAQLGLDHEPVEDTAGAVELLLSNKMLDTAAIASSQAAVLYGLDVLAHGLQDESWNVTRFLILSKDPQIGLKRQLRVKTSMVVAHHTGSLSVLLKVLATLSSRNINLTKLEVNPFSKNDGSFKILDPQKGGSSLKEFPSVLYVDIEGSIDDQKVQDAIAEISELPVFVRILGCYSADPTIYGLH